MTQSDSRSPTAEQQLVSRVASGDEQALGQLYDRFGSTLYSLAYAMLRDVGDAEEVVADAFAQVWRTADRFEQTRGSVAAWLSMITRSRALDRLRARKRGVRALETASRGDEDGLALPVSAADDPPDRRAEQHQTRDLVLQSLSSLPEPQRRALELAYFSGLTQSEIATQLGEPLGTVKTRMRAGLEKLRQALSPLRAGGQL